MSHRLTVIYSAANLQQAYALKNLLAELGIDAQLYNEALQGAVGEVPTGWATAPRLVVAEDQAAAARALVLAMERRGWTTPEALALAETAAEPGHRVWADWPLCPACGQRRHAFCPLCRTTGDAFPLADEVPAAAPLQPTRPQDATGPEGGLEPMPAPIQLLCPLCGELLTPQFLRRCPTCNHEFADGLDPPT